MPGGLAKPANKDGVLNVGAGHKPIDGAYNIDIKPSVHGVHQADATNLSNITSDSQRLIYIENPFGYDPLNPEILRVLQSNGKIDLTGAASNKWFVNSVKPSNLERLGLEIVDQRTVTDLSKYTTTGGSSLKGSELSTYIIRKKQ